jgi:photosystem II stability/assembly factor-like uncharacterized protein
MVLLIAIAALPACNGPAGVTKGPQPVAKEPWLIEKGKVLQLTGETDVLGRRDLPGETRSTRMPDMVALSDDCWLVVYIEYATPYKRGDWARLVVTRTADAGKTWQTQVLSTSRKGDRPGKAGGSMASIRRLRDGRLVISTSVGGTVHLFFSGDDGKTWSPPHDAGLAAIMKEQLGRAPGLVQAHRILELPGGTLLMMPHEAAPGPLAGWTITHVFASDDGGKTWSYRSTVKDDAYALCEPAMYARGKRVQIYCRDNHRPLPEHNPVVLRSEDEGRTWAVVRVAREISGGHQATLTPLRDGRALLIFRSLKGCGWGNGIGVWVHDPETLRGNVYPVVRAGGSWSNDSGAAAELSDGTILLVYATIYKTAETTWPEKRLQLLILPPGTLET